MQMEWSARDRARVVGWAAVAGLFLLFVYIVLHEGGHALVGLLSGGRLEVFQISPFAGGPFVRFREASALPAARLLNNLAGMALPAAAWTVFLLLAPRRGSLPLELLKAFGTMGVCGTLAVWVAVPVLALFGAAPAGEDATRFLQNSGLPPLLVSACFLLLLAGLFGLFLRGTYPLGQWRAVSARPPAADWQGPAMRRLLAGMAMVAALAAALAAAASLSASGPAASQPPAGYSLLATATLNDSQGEAPVARFTLSEPGEVGLYLSLRDMRCALLEARLRGPGGFDDVLLHAEGYTSTEHNIAYSQTLAAGEYRLVLITRAASGRVAVYSNRK